MRRHFARTSYAAIMAATMGITGTAMAQEPQADQGARAADGEIVVTARRREERLQDVPVAVTALSGEALVKRGITDVLDLPKSTPGLNVGSSPRGNSSPFVVLRGQRVIDTSIVLDSPVLFYVNEVPFMRMNGLNQAFYDIENVQVLRGPQGTLFGKSTTGGAMLISSQKAKLNEFSGYGRVSTGSYSFIRGEAAVNIPLAEDKFAMRLAATISRRDGYMKSRNFPGLDLNNEHYDAERLSFHYEDEGLTNDFIANRFSTHDNGTANPIFALNESAPSLRGALATTIPGANPAAGLTPAQTAQVNALIAQMKADIAANNADFYSVGNDFNTRYPQSQTTWDITNITSYELNDNLTIKNVFGYRDIDAPIYYDFDGSSVAYQEFYSFAKVWQVSDELQLSGTSTNFDWMVGAFYLKEKGNDGAQQTIRSTGVVTDSGTFATNESYSAFASGTYRFGLEGLSLTAGVRLSHDKREGQGYQKRNGNCTFLLAGANTPASTADDVVLPQPCLYYSKTSFTEPSWSVSLNYKVNPDLLVYAAHRHGYRSGGVQNRATNTQSATPFGAEKVNDVEIGGKFDSEVGSGVRFLLNVAAYKAWYTDLQRILSFTAGNPPLIVSGVANAADATITGVEAESRLRVGGFELMGNVGYTDAKFKSFSQSLTPAVVNDLSSAPGFSIVPKWTWMAQASYSLPLTHDKEELTANISANHVGKVFTSELPVFVGTELPGYTLVDARIGWNRIAGSGFDLAVSVTNLFDKEYANFANSFGNSTGWAVRFVGPPRRVQGSVTYNF